MCPDGRSVDGNGSGGPGRVEPVDHRSGSCTGVITWLHASGAGARSGREPTGSGRHLTSRMGEGGTNGDRGTRRAGLDDQRVPCGDPGRGQRDRGHGRCRQQGRRGRRVRAAGFCKVIVAATKALGVETKSTCGDGGSKKSKKLPADLPPCTVYDRERLTGANGTFRLIHAEISGKDKITTVIDPATGKGGDAGGKLGVQAGGNPVYKFDSHEEAEEFLEHRRGNVFKRAAGAFTGPTDGLFDRWPTSSGASTAGRSAAPPGTPSSSTRTANRSRSSTAPRRRAAASTRSATRATSAGTPTR